MKLIGIALCWSALFAVGLGAQTQETQTKTKVAIKSGKEVTVTGCVARSLTDPGFVLTNAADRRGALPDYTLITDSDLSKYVGHRVRVDGKATDRGDANVEVVAAVCP